MTFCLESTIIKSEKNEDIKNVVVLLHDSGTRYIGKVYNDEWMKKQGFKLD